MPLLVQCGTGPLGQQRGELEIEGLSRNSLSVSLFLSVKLGPPPEWPEETWVCAGEPREGCPMTDTVSGLIMLFSCVTDGLVTLKETGKRPKVE